MIRSKIEEYSIKRLPLLDAFPLASAIRQGRKIVYTNEALRTLFRCGSDSADTLRQLAHVVLIAPLSDSTVPAQQLRTALIRGDGQCFLGEIRVSAIDWNGKNAELLCVSDVTREEHAVSTLNNIAAGSLEGILVHRDMKPLFVNDAYVKMFGYDSQEQVLGLKSILEFTAPEDREKVLTYYRARMRGEDVPRRYTHRARTRNGRDIFIDNLMTVVDWNGEPAVQVTNFDITDFILAQQQGERSRLGMLSEIACGMAQRFSEHVESLNRELSVARTNAYLLGGGHVIAAVDRGAAVVSDMKRDLDKLILMAREGEPVSHPVDLNEVVSEVAKHWISPTAGPARFGKIRFAFQQQPQLPLVMGDRLQLQQAIQIVIENAVEAMPTGGVVTVVTRIVVLRHSRDHRKPGRYVVVEIADEGPGIDPSIRPALGAPFITTKEGHAGFGVFTLVLIVERHAGHAEFEHSATGGTRIVLTLPTMK